MKKLNNHIEEYLIQKDGNSNLVSKEIFKADLDNTDIKTELSIQEIVLINKLKFNDILLKSRGLKSVYSEFLNNYMRLKISLDRKSREEFVKINKSKDSDDVVNTMSNFSNILGAKK